MKEGIRTLVFLAVAAVSVAAAAFVQTRSRPDAEAGFARLGEPFFKDFTDPTAAKSLEISEYDEDLATVRSFKVDYDQGRWRLKSYHGYPAEAKERLYEIAAAFIGLEREALAGRFESSHRRYGVIAPDSDDMTALEGRGQRVILRDAQGEELVDLIIGKQPEGRTDSYYVRVPAEDETYLVRLDLDEISTRFADWIEQDLLKLSAGDLVLIERETAEAEPVRLSRDVAVFQKTGGQSVTLTRQKAGFSEPWHLVGLNDPTLELKKDAVSTITGAIDNLEYEGVRLKPDWLTGELTVDRGNPRFQATSAREFLVNYSPILVSELASKGFRLAVEPANLKAILDPAQDPQDVQFELYGEAGDLVVGTDEGLKYYLHFGNSFGGTRREIEVGQTGTVSAEDEENPEDFLKPDEEDSQEKPAAEDAAKKDAPKPDAGKSDSGREETLSRFLLLRVAFDPSLVAGKPQKPEPPADQPAIAQKADASTPAPDPQAEYKQALADYEADLKTYEKKLADQRAKARELNGRFENYYYLVSNDSYEKLVFTTGELTQPKTAEPPKDNAGPPTGEAPPFNIPGLPTP